MHERAGRARWDTWTELFNHLRKHMPDEKARHTAAKWFRGEGVLARRPTSTASVKAPGQQGRAW